MSYLDHKSGKTYVPDHRVDPSLVIGFTREQLAGWLSGDEPPWEIPIDATHQVYANPPSYIVSREVVAAGCSLSSSLG